MGPQVKIFSGNGSRELAEKIAKRFGGSIGKINIQKFSDHRRNGGSIGITPGKHPRRLCVFNTKHLCTYR